MRTATILKIRWILIAVLCLALAGCFSREQVTRNIRVIVQAEVDGKIVEGSAVMGIRWQAGDNTRMYIKSNTEAVILEIPERGVAYVINAYKSKRDGRINVGYWPNQILAHFNIKGNGHINDFPKLRSLKGRFAVRPVPNAHFSQSPLIVGFKDDAKRETMFEVKTTNFSKVFGVGVRFKGMWFEFTDDEPTDSGLRQRLQVMWKANQTYREVFPLRDASGKLIAGVDKEFPQKVGRDGFYMRGY